MVRRSRLLTALCVGTLALGGAALVLTSDATAEQKRKPAAPTRTPDVVFVPTPQEAVDKMLELAGVQKGDLHFDLGCGDGRIVVTSAKKYGVKAVGIDIDPQRVKESRENVAKNELEKLVEIRHADIFETDISGADVVTLYLLPDLNVRLMPQLRKLKPGSRIVSYQFDMVGAKPTEVYEGKYEDGYEYTIYKWVVPWEEEKVEPEDDDKDE